MAESAFRGAIEFFDRLGVYDVVLPFLLIWTIIFAILEKTKIFGTEKIGKEEYPRKNLNAMTAFVVALVFVASQQLVEIVNQSIAKIMLLVILVVMFLITIGLFFEDGKIALSSAWKGAGMVTMLVAILLIISYQLGWLEPAWDYLMDHWNESVVGSIFLVILIIWFMSFMGKSEAEPEKPKGGTS